MKKTNLKRLIALVLSATAITMNFTGAFSAYAGGISADDNATIVVDEQTPLFEMVDENGDVVDVITSTLTNTYYVDANTAVPAALVTPSSGNRYDLADGEYVYETSSSSNVYEMPKWFNCDSSGCMYISSFVIDADGTMKFYRYDEEGSGGTHFWLIREYELEVSDNNPRARQYVYRVRYLNEESDYTFLVQSTGGNFTYGLLKASWSSIDPSF